MAAAISPMSASTKSHISLILSVRFSSNASMLFSTLSILPFRFVSTASILAFVASILAFTVSILRSICSLVRFSDVVISSLIIGRTSSLIMVRMSSLVSSPNTGDDRRSRDRIAMTSHGGSAPLERAGLNMVSRFGWFRKAFVV